MNAGTKIKLFLRQNVNCFFNSYRLNTMNVFAEKAGQPIRVSPLRFEDYKATLQNYGFHDFQARRILEEVPEILNLQKDVLSRSFMNWCAFKIPDQDLLNTLTSYPRLLLFDSERLNSRVTELLTLFTQKNISKLLRTCPEVFFNDFDTSFKKVQYFVHQMGVEQSSIVKTEALHFGIRHIKLRHKFLIYVGVFKKPKAKLKSKNAPLNKILHKNVNTFLKLSGLTVEEYEVFDSIFDEIIDEEEEEDDVESDDEEDDDD